MDIQLFCFFVHEKGTRSSFPHDLAADSLSLLMTLISGVGLTLPVEHNYNGTSSLAIIEKLWKNVGVVQMLFEVP